MTKIIGFFLALTLPIAAIAACQEQSNNHASSEEQANAVKAQEQVDQGAQEPVVPTTAPKPVSADPQKIAAASQKLPLPPFPDYRAPVTRLSEDSQGEIYFPTKSPYDFSRLLHDWNELPTHSGKGTLILPEGASASTPVPAMVILHGSGGIKKGREFEYADWFKQMGIAAFVVDYYAPRGVTEETPYVMKTMAATEVDVIADAFSALNILATHSAIDAKRIGVTGYSYGGMATRYVLDKRLKNRLAPSNPPFALHMDIYGSCHQNTGSWETTGAPYLAVYGTADNSVDPKTCETVQQKLRDGGSEVEVLIIDGAGHAWENDEPKFEWAGAYIRGCEFSFDPQSGAFLIDGKSGTQPGKEMGREERAFLRGALAQLAQPCIGYGYTVGNDPKADAESRERQKRFLRKYFDLKAQE